SPSPWLAQTTSRCAMPCASMPSTSASRRSSPRGSISRAAVSRTSCARRSTSTTPRRSSTASSSRSTLREGTANVAWRLLPPRISRRGGGRRGIGMLGRRLWTGLAVLAGALLGASSGYSQSLLRVAPETLSRILDPHFTTSFTTRDLGYLVFDTLFAVDDHFEPRPQMVERYTLSDDRLTYTFVLRPGLKWHDGQPVTAADCVASLRRLASRD